jgi:hypothetical protein
MGTLQDFSVDQLAGAAALILCSCGGLLMIIWKSIAVSLAEVFLSHIVSYIRPARNIDADWHKYMCYL